MTDADRIARNRYFLMTGVNLVAVGGAVLGLLIAGRSQDNLTSILGGALILVSLYCMAIVPRAMARKWKTPENP